MPRRRRRLAVAASVVAVMAAGVAAVVVTFARVEEPAAAQPNRGRFIVECSYSHSAPDDPIVWPGEPGRSHLHDFFGNTEVDAFSTAASLEGADTTCAQRQDRASYWAPSLFRGDEQIRPNSSDAYYRAAPGVDPTTVQPYPFGLVMISGDATSAEAQSTDVVGWGCGRNPRLAPEPQVCGRGSPLMLHVFFQDCWDGRSLDSEGHQRHVARSEEGACPASHPVQLPQLEFVVQYPVWGDPAELRLASGQPFTAHADFLNVWGPEKLANEVAHCIGLDAVCGVPSL